jgi:hypothetical protein
LLERSLKTLVRADSTYWVKLGINSENGFFMPLAFAGGVFTFPAQCKLLVVRFQYRNRSTILSREEGITPKRSRTDASPCEEGLEGENQERQGSLVARTRFICTLAIIHKSTQGFIPTVNQIYT